jgi:hypothetical protein
MDVGDAALDWIGELKLSTRAVETDRERDLLGEFRSGPWTDGRLNCLLGLKSGEDSGVL